MMSESALQNQILPYHNSFIAIMQHRDILLTKLGSIDILCELL